MRPTTRWPATVRRWRRLLWTTGRSRRTCGFHGGGDVEAVAAVVDRLCARKRRGRAGMDVDGLRRALRARQGRREAVRGGDAASREGVARARRAEPAPPQALCGSAAVDADACAAGGGLVSRRRAMAHGGQGVVTREGAWSRGTWSRGGCAVRTLRTHGKRRHATMWTSDGVFACGGRAARTSESEWTDVA